MRGIWGLYYLASIVSDWITHWIWRVGESPPPEAEEPVLNTRCKWCRQEMYNVQEFCSHCGRQRFTGQPKGQ